MSKEKWIDEILQSAGDIRRVSSDPFMTSCVETKLLQSTRLEDRLPLKWVYASAAALGLLLLLNISAWRSHRQPSAPAGLQQLLQEYGWSTGNGDSFNSSNPRYE